MLLGACPATYQICNVCEHEQIHIAAWPSFSLYRDVAYSLGPEVNTAVTQTYAVEGQCFVIAPSSVVSPEMIEILCMNDDARKLLPEGGGHARILAQMVRL